MLQVLNATKFCNNSLISELKENEDIINDTLNNNATNIDLGKCEELLKKNKSEKND